MRKKLLTRFGFGAVVPILLSVSAIAQTSEPSVININKSRVQLAPCYAKGLPDQLQCGSIEQPLTAEGSGSIRIHFAVIPAIKSLYPTEAVLAFAGGPGQSAFDAAAVFANALRFARETRDIVLVDQRGTGKSGMLTCVGMDQTSQYAFDDSKVDLVALSTNDAKTCKDTLQVDLSHYTTVAAAKDFEAVRLVLGYQKLHLYGGSYGTRMAQEYMRQYPQAVLTATLDGVIANQQSLATLGESSAQSLAALYQFCAESDSCVQNFVQAEQQLQTLFNRLEHNPIHTTIRHPRTHQQTELVLTRLKLQQALRFALYSHTTRSLIPLAIAQAEHGDYSGIMGLMLGQDITESLAIGVNTAVICAEDWPFWTEQTRALYGQNYLGKLWMDITEAQCKVWQVTPVAATFTQPLNTATPVLLLSGGLDPVTPPLGAEMAMAQMTQATHLIAPFATHIVASQSCAPKLISQFITERSSNGLDTDCLQKELRKPFLVNANGAAAPATGKE